MIRFEGESKDIAKLTTKLVGILSECEAVKKSGFNKAQSYQYATERDILEVVRGQLVKNSIFVFSSANTKEVQTLDKFDYKTGTKNGETVLAVVNGEHAFVDGETGARIIVSSTGTGWDMTDKGVFKAWTGLQKYMFSKNFLIETEDDPERDGANPGYVRSEKITKTSTSTAAPKSFSKNLKKSVAPTFQKAETTEEVVEQTEEPAPKRRTFGKREFVNKDTKTEANF